MAITIEQTPETYAPVFAPMVFVCSSNNVNGQNFFYYLIRVKDSTATVISQHRIAPHYDNDLMKWDAGFTLEPYCIHDFTNIANQNFGVKQSNVFKEYTIDFIEEYGSVASGLATGGTASTSTLYAYNGCLLPEEFSTFDDADYLITTTGTNKFLTDLRGQSIRIKTGQSFELGWITSAGASEPSKSVVIKTYNSSGSLLGTYKIANSFSAGTTGADKFLSVLCGTSDLNSSTLSSGSQPIITAAVDTYQVYIENNSSTQVSEIMTFKIDTTCQLSETPIRLYWVNSKGRIDAFNFNFESDRSKQVNRSQYRRLRGSFTGSTFGTETSEHGLSNFYTDSQRTILVRSDYLTDTEAQWMENLVDSPALWGEIDGEFIPLVMKTNSYKRQTVQKNKLFYVEFECDYSVINYRQRL